MGMCMETKPCPEGTPSGSFEFTKLGQQFLDFSGSQTAPRTITPHLAFDRIQHLGEQLAIFHTEEG